MKKIASLLLLALSIATITPAVAGPQQEKMKTCNKEAKGMKGDERKAFMKKCLKKDSDVKAPVAAAPADAKADKKADEPKAADAAPKSQKEKMKSCNADAKAKKLKGADRKSFMKSCLKG